MGRHSASYIAAQKRLSTGPTAAGAAMYVGRVGSLAIALGLGAAVAGGAGIANAENPADNSPGGPAAQSSPDTSTGDGTAKGPSAGESPTTESPVAETPKPGLLNTPNTELGDNRTALTADRQDAGGDPGSLPQLIAGIPQKIAAALLSDASSATSGPTTAPTDVRPTPQIRSRASAKQAVGPTHAGPFATDDAHADPFERDVRALVATPPPAADAIEHRRAPSPPMPSAVPVAVAHSTATAALTQAKPAPASAVATVVSGLLSAVGLSPSASSTDDAPVAPMPMVLGVLQLVRREIENTSLIQASPTALSTSAPPTAVPAIAPGVPAPTDEVPTAYGNIGKWMLQSNGQISNYGGQLYGGKTLLEPVNVIIVDPTSKSPAEATKKLNADMLRAGFPAQPVHTTGFQGKIDDVTYGQQPTGLFQGFSDNLFVLPNDHGRIFGPDPVETSTGYVWSGAFSSEQFGLYNLLPAHTYVSSNTARNALATRLIASGQATYGGMVPLNNAYNTATTTTGDHDGYAVVLVLK